MPKRQTKKRATSPLKGDEPLAHPNSDEFKLQIKRYLALRGDNGWVYVKLNGEMQPMLLYDISYEGSGIAGNGHLDLKYMSPVGPVDYSIHYKYARVRDMRVSEFLDYLEVYPQSPARYTSYERMMLTYRAMLLQVGKPYLVDGLVTEGFDCELLEWEAQHYQDRRMPYLRAVHDHEVVIDHLWEARQLDTRTATWIHLTNDYERDVAELLETRPFHDAFWNRQDPLVNRVTPTLPMCPLVSIYNLVSRQRQVAHVNALRPNPVDVASAKRVPLVVSEELLTMLDKILRYEAGSQEDLISGKYGGALILLQGEPGTGKTLTAEVCTRRIGRTLYSVQCAELGLDPVKLDRRLRVVFDRAVRWNAVLLLDEADVFVLKRDRDIYRSALVDAFIRVLEYQDAAMFLTTNVPLAEVDAAVKSRCLMQYQFGKMSEEQRVRLWRALSKHYGLLMEVGAVEDLAKDDLPGREIKRLTRLAAVLIPKTEKVTATMLRKLHKFGVPD